jgi:hypothetical protein
MDEKTAVVKRQCSWTHEILFSLNLAWMVIWYERVRSSTRLGSLPIVRYLYRNTHFVEPKTVIEQVCWSVVVGVSIFVVFRLLSRLSVTRAFLRTVGGALALTGFPFFTVSFPLALFSPLRIEACGPWLIPEALVVLLCGSLYYLRKWPLSAGPSVGLVLLHFSLWSWASGTWVNPAQEVRVYGLGGVGIWISTVFYIGFPLLGFLSSLAWARYVECDQAPRMLTIPSQEVAHL